MKGRRWLIGVALVFLAAVVWASMQPGPPAIDRATIEKKLRVGMTVQEVEAALGKSPASLVLEVASNGDSYVELAAPSVLCYVKPQDEVIIRFDKQLRLSRVWWAIWKKGQRDQVLQMRLLTAP